MKTMTTMCELKAKAIALNAPIKVCWPQRGDKQETLNPDYVANSILEHSYAINNGTIAFVDEAVLYVIPYFRKAMSILQDNGFIAKNFYVPFSNWDYPVMKKARWEELKNEAYKQHVIEFIADCNEFSDKHGFGVLDEAIIQKCFEMPVAGVHVEHPYYENILYPAIQGTCLDCVAATKIGRYCTNNGTCVFVYRDGKTYVTRNWEVVAALSKAGYKEGSLFVPFSNGETIQDPEYAAKWKRVSA